MAEPMRQLDSFLKFENEIEDDIEEEDIRLWSWRLNLAKLKLNLCSC